jgi:DNA-binding transcriptional ArsR family regulator
MARTSPKSGFEIIAEPARRALLTELTGGPRDVGALARATGLSQPNTSRHLRIMREAGVVEFAVSGRHRHYELRPEGLAEVAGWLTPYVLLLARGRRRGAQQR